MAVTRGDLEQNQLHTTLGNLPIASLLLTGTALEASLASALTRLSAAHGDYQDAWVFGYGSLTWNPMIFRTKAVRTTVHGYHRGFYLYSRIDHDIWDNPGLVLGLDRGGSCRGVAFRVSRDRVEHEFRVFWCREILTDAYLPRWLSTEINGRRVLALAFVMSRIRETYADCLPDKRMVGCLREAVGLHDPTREYLQCMLIGLASNELHSPYLNRLWSRLQVTDTVNGPCATTDATDVTYTAPLPDPYLST